MSGVRICDLARKVNGRVVGDGEVEITGLRDLRSAGPADLSFVGHARVEAQARESTAGCLLVRESLGDRPQILCSDPYLALALLTPVLSPKHTVDSGIHPSAQVAPSARVSQSATLEAGVVIAEHAIIGDETHVMAQAYVGAGATVGRACLLHPGVRVLHGVILGDRCILHSGSVLGSDGFGYACDKATGRRHKLPQTGSVRVGDDVEIGANTTVDRATFGETVIGSGTKIDNLVQIGHNVEIGQDCVIVSQAGVAGSAKIGNRVVLGAQGGIVGHIQIVDDVMLIGRAGVTRAVGKPGVYAGFPLVPHPSWLKVQGVYQNLPALRNRVRDLEARLKRLETCSSSD